MFYFIGSVSDYVWFLVVNNVDIYAFLKARIEFVLLVKFGIDSFLCTSVCHYVINDIILPLGFYL